MMIRLRWMMSVLIGVAVLAGCTKHPAPPPTIQEPSSTIREPLELAWTAELRSDPDHVIVLSGVQEVIVTQYFHPRTRVLYFDRAGHLVREVDLPGFLRKWAPDAGWLLMGIPTDRKQPFLSLVFDNLGNRIAEFDANWSVVDPTNDGKRVLVSGYYEWSGLDLAVHDLSGQVLWRAEGPHDGGKVLYADKEYILYDPTAVWSFDPNGMKRTELFRVGNGSPEISGARASADGTTIMVFTGNLTIVLDRTGQVLAELRGERNWGSSRDVISPDGKRILLFGQVIDREGQVVLARDAAETCNWYMSPEGNLVFTVCTHSMSKEKKWQIRNKDGHLLWEHAVPPEVLQSKVVWPQISETMGLLVVRHDTSISAWKLPLRR